MGVQLGCYASTILAEFAMHGDQCARFTFVHIMQRMGFDAADVNSYGAMLDETFYHPTSPAAGGVVTDGLSLI